MKRIIAFILTSVLFVSVLCFSASADFDFDNGKTVFGVETGKKVTFSYQGSTSASAHPRGSSTLDCLADGDAATGVTAHDQDGIVLVCNDIIKPQYEENLKNGIDPAMTDQPIDAVPNFSFVIEYEENVRFDAVYLALLHETNACVATPGGNSVTVEYSRNGSDWTPAGTDGIYYYRAANLPEYEMNDTSHNTAVEERIVPLGKEYTAKYIRLTFNFMQVPEENVWRYYTNVYEWTGFTELAVASYESGEKPEVMEKEEADIPDAVIDGEWMASAESVYVYYKFEDGKYESAMYLITDYDADPFGAKPIAQDSGEFDVYGAEVVLRSDAEDIEDTVLSATFEGEKLKLNDGLDELVFEQYVEPVPETSETDSSAEESSEAEESEEESDYAVSAVSWTPPEDDGEDSDNTMTVILTVVAAAVVVLVAVVVTVIIRKKKKQ